MPQILIKHTPHSVWPCTKALLDELTRRGLMPGRPDTASMEAALTSLATGWDADAAAAAGRMPPRSR
jgi:hypothetical protein